MARTAYAAPGAAAQPRINRIAPADLWLSLRQGWADFMAAPTQIFFLCLVYPVFGLVLARAAAGGALLPLVWPLLTGFALVGPVAALGLYEMSRRRELGFAVTWRDMFGVLRSPAVVGILLLGLALVAILVVWLGAARLLYHGLMGPEVPATIAALRDQLLTREGLMLAVLGHLMGAGFALLVLAVSVVSFPMMLDREVSPGEAVQTSLAAFCANPFVLTLWGVVVAVLLFVGMATLVGLAVALPVLGHATWHLYRRLVF
ncbi:DUF2189 domain-containing protein [Roseococcus sp. SYP-B2431]|uniref:DUF2189 domain-containing protein n=1 Tax=Roseococcus sp. SYP-B2431 TaxID=2496640 RepID=UPI00103F32CE|nr:DUF2189 domain-containing protein [Roseococcus sp. SYP-B2431]TCH99597.1 DUF2189 domain-containing protein [Roseococcus sp. SYP-B2431]